MNTNPNFPLSSLKFASYTPIGKDQQKKLVQIINNMIDTPQATDFLHPVPWKELQLDDYLDVVRHPMNLYKVQEKMNARVYNTVEEVLDHSQLIWDNCKDYNKEGYYFEIAQKMEKIFKKMIKNYFPSIQYSYQPSIVFSKSKGTSNSSVQPQNSQQIASRKFNVQSALQPSARNAPHLARNNQKLSSQRSQPPVYNKQEQSQEQKQAQSSEQQVQQVPLSQKTRFQQRIKQITHEEVAQIVQIIKQFSAQGFKHVSGNRYQIIVDNIDPETFRKANQKIDQFLQNEKLNGISSGGKKVKV